VALTPGASFNAGSFFYVSAVVSGVARDSFNNTLAGVTITAQDGAGFYNQVTTGADGSFTIHLHVGTNYLHISNAGFYPSPGVVTLANLPAGVDPTPVVITFASAKVSGTVTAHATCDACTDQPVAGATVYALSGASVVGTATTGANGAYSMFVATGSISVQVTPLHGYTVPTQSTSVGTLAAGDSKVQDLQIDVNGTVNGSVVDDRGVGLDGVHIVVGNADCTASPEFCAVTAGGGLFTVSAPAGTGVSFVVNPGPLASYTHPASTGPLTLASGRSTSVSFTYARDGELDGRVLDSAGNPLAGVFVAVQLASGERTWTTSNADGTYTLAAPVGAVTVYPL